MNRINPEQIAQFFVTHPHITPERDSFVEFVDDENRDIESCCGTVACILANPEADDECDFIYQLSDRDTTVVQAALWIGKLLGLDSRYVTGFIMGWDDHKPVEMKSDACKNGYADGLLAYETTMEILDR